jgi:hypothetical protein
MATQTVPHVVEQSKPAVVVPTTKRSTETVSQTELELIISLRGRLQQLEEQVESAEESIRRRLESGAAIEPGVHTASLETSYRRNVSWKSVAERLANRFKLYGYVARVLAATRPTPVVSLEIN